MQETSTNIRIPNEEDPSDVIRIEGDPAGVKKVKAELMEMAKKMVGYVPQITVVCYLSVLSSSFSFM